MACVGLFSCFSIHFPFCSLCSLTHTHHTGQGHTALHLIMSLEIHRKKPARQGNVSPASSTQVAVSGVQQQQGGGQVCTIEKLLG